MRRPLRPMFAYVVLPFMGLGLKELRERGPKPLQKRVFYSVG